MKKILLSLLALCGVANLATAENTDIEILDNVVYIESLTSSAGATLDLTLHLKNTDSLQTVQFNLRLPDGMSFVTDESGDPICTASKQRSINTILTAFSPVIQEDGSLLVLANISQKKRVAPGDSEFANVKVSISNELTSGDYPLTIDGILIVNDGIGIQSANSTESTITIESHIVLDETSTVAPIAATGVDVRVIRSITADQWNTICLPFAMTEEQVKAAFGEDVMLADFNGIECTYAEDGETVTTINIKFTSVPAIMANHPYLINVSQDVTEFEVDGVDIAPSEELSVDCDEMETKVGKKTYTFYNSLVGTYVGNYAIGEDMLFLSDGTFQYSTEATTINAYSAYFDFYDVLTDPTTAATAISISIDGQVVTGISLTPSPSPNGEGRIYDLSGRRVSAPARGIYVKQGRKVVVK